MPANVGVTDPDTRFMARALELAARGAGWVNPNPMVGCVIVGAGGDIIGEGWHKEFGGLHAEREALADCAARGDDPAGSTVYVTLEPCCHWGKTPPCTDALIEAQVARVVVGVLDVNPLVAGNGCAALEAAGIAVEVGILEEECRALNDAFFYYTETQKPYLIAKYAMTLDGRIATHTGESKWITGEAAREHVHASRAACAAVMVGVGTVLADDPLLNCRLSAEAAQECFCRPAWHQPARIICDAHACTPLDSQLVRTAHDIPLIIAVADDAPADAVQAYKDAGCTVLKVAASEGRLYLDRLMAELGKLQIDSVYVEGGPTLLGALFDAKLVQRLQVYVAPKIFGGAGAPCAIGGTGVSVPAHAARMVQPQLTMFGNDVLFEGKVEYN